MLTRIVAISVSMLAAVAPQGVVPDATGAVLSNLDAKRQNPRSCENTQSLHLHPIRRPGPTELIGGIYGVGGPARHSKCLHFRVTLPSTIIVRHKGTTVIVAMRIVESGQRFKIRLKPGAYTVESTACKLAHLVAITMVKHRSILLDFACPIK